MATGATIHTANGLDVIVTPRDLTSAAAATTPDVTKNAA